MIFFRLIILISGFLLLGFSTEKVQAVCPVCTVAVVTGLGLSRWLGIDDTVSGIWVGGLVISSGLWLSSWLKGKKIKIPYLPIWSIVLMFLFVLPPLIISGIIGHKLNTLWGIDKLVLGISVGSVLFSAGVFGDRMLRVLNNGKVKFYYQKVILPVATLIIGSLVFYLITQK
jgi:hypothetical protein